MRHILLLFLTLMVLYAVGCAAPAPTPTPTPPTAMPTRVPTVAPTATLVPETALSDVALDRGNTKRTGVYNVQPLDKVPAIKWQTRVSSTWLMPPLFVDDIVYAGGGDGTLYALNAETGAKVWSAEGFDQMETTGAVAGDTIVAGGYSQKVMALNRHTGDELWTFTAGSAVQGAPLIVDETVYIATDRKAYALNLDDGNLIWESVTGDGGAYMAGPAYEDGVLYTTGANGLYALDAATGKEKWHVPAEMQYCGLAVGEDKIFVGNFDKYMRAYDKTTGAEVWKFKGENVFWSSPAVRDGLVYTGNIDRNLYALDEDTGDLVWSYHTAGDALSEPVLAGNVLYISDSAHDAPRGARHLYALNAKSGDLIWDFEMTSSFLPAPAVTNGTLFVTITGQVLALE